MSEIPAITQINKTFFVCPTCNIKLIMCKCNLTVYWGTKHNGKRKGYISTSLLYCGRCESYFATQDEIQYLHTYSNHSVVKFNIVQDDMRKSIHNDGIPYIMTSVKICTSCGYTADMFTHRKTKVLVYQDIQKVIKHGHISILVPVCHKCNKIVVCKNDTFFVNDILLHYKPLKGQYTINNAEHLSRLVVQRFGIYSTNVVGITQLHNMHTSAISQRTTKFVLADGTVLKNSVQSRTLGYQNDKSHINSVIKTNLNLRKVDLTHGDDPYPIHICHGTLGCHYNHEIEEVAAKVLTLKKDDLAVLNVGYCKICNKYFIHRESYNRYVKYYGHFIIKPIPYNQSFSDDYDNMYANMSPQSVLSSHGYSSSWDTTELERQIILSTILEFRLMRKRDIIEFLQDLTGRIQKNTPTMFHANIKRKADLQFVNDYEIHRQREIFGYIVERAERFRRGR